MTPVKIKLAILGDKDFDDIELFYNTITKFQLRVSTVVSGGCRGADKMGNKWATTHNIQTEVHLPDWKLYGKTAGVIKNKLIIAASDAVVIFWNGRSPDTKTSINMAKKLNKPVMIVKY